MPLTAALLAALVLTPLIGVSKPRRYIDARHGFSVRYASPFRVRAFAQEVPGNFVSGVTVTNRPGGPLLQPGDERTAAPGTVAFTVWQEHRFPPSFFGETHETRFPVSRSTFIRLGPPGNPWYATLVRANGSEFRLSVYVPPRARHELRAAVWRVVSSLRFRGLSPGELVGDGVLVAGLARTYPVRSARRFQRFFVVHAPLGFYALEEPRDCTLSFEPATFTFVCADGTRRFDRMGRGSDGNGLWLHPALIGQDGHVLISLPDGGGQTPEGEREYWGS